LCSFNIFVRLDEAERCDVYQHSYLLGDFVWVFILKSELVKRIVLLLKYLGHFMGLPVPDPKGAF